MEDLPLDLLVLLILATWLTILGTSREGYWTFAGRQESVGALFDLRQDDFMHFLRGKGEGIVKVLVVLAGFL